MGCVHSQSNLIITTTNSLNSKCPLLHGELFKGAKKGLCLKLIICDYLNTLGIITDKLQDIELPSTVQVMRERVEFLQKLGLSIDDINEYPLMLGFSVRKNMIPVLGYLEKIGISRSKLGFLDRNWGSLSRITHKFYMLVWWLSLFLQSSSFAALMLRKKILDMCCLIILNCWVIKEY